MWTQVLVGSNPTFGTMNNNKGFTLIELLVVMAIIGLITSITLVILSNAREKAQITQAQSELHQLSLAIEFLYDDTKLHPGGISPLPCVQNPEVYLNTCAAGLECADGGFSNWNGPYMTFVPQDPWGTYYYFDPDYRCRTFVQGCEGIPDNAWLRAILSFGPNKSGNYDDGDNIVFVLCR